MQGPRRRIVYVTLYELIAIVATSIGLSVFSDSSVERAGVAAVVSSAIAVVWNVVFNTLFERWEARQTVRGRSLARRAAHAIGFEGGLVVTLVPFFAWWLDISLWQAFVLDLGLLLFFLVYTFVFNWVFDRVFGLPASALPVGEDFPTANEVKPPQR
ncbi:MAG: PACE efflux transporter [Burkholderiaceae bacterium]|nr:PACE efflux transporter [Burkholderiaceae bacterium]